MKIKRFEFNMFPVNCYVLSDETREAVVIDAGCFYPEEGEQLKKYLNEEGLQLKHVLNTPLRTGSSCSRWPVPSAFGPHLRQRFSDA